MLRSLFVLSCALAAAASSPAEASSASSAVVGAAPRQKEMLWYPEFASDYESGTCTTTPSASLLAFAAGSSGDNAMAHSDRASCCAKWFGHQEGGACLGDGDDAVEADAQAQVDASAEASDAAPTQSSVAADIDADDLADEDEAPESDSRMWYPHFDLTYDSGRCVKLGVNADLPPPSYYTAEGGFLHETMEGCCSKWFGDQESGSCLGPDGDAVSVAGVNGTSRPKNKAEGVEVVVEPRGAEPIFVAAEKGSQ